MKQKVLSLFLAACMTAALVAGCGSTKNTANMENGGTEGSTVSNSTESGTQTADTAASESGIIQEPEERGKLLSASSRIRKIWDHGRACLRDVSPY